MAFRKATFWRPRVGFQWNRRSLVKRRDFNRIALGASLSPLLTGPVLAQMSAGEIPKAARTSTSQNVIIKNSPRTYNQINVPRKYTAGRRRFSIYWTWNYPWESNRDVTELDNRFSTMTEVRRVGWPRYETPEWSARQFLQGIAGTISPVDSTVSEHRRPGYGTARGRL